MGALSSQSTSFSRYLRRELCDFWFFGCILSFAGCAVGAGASFERKVADVSCHTRHLHVALVGGALRTPLSTFRAYLISRLPTVAKLDVVDLASKEEINKEANESSRDLVEDECPKKVKEVAEEGHTITLQDCIEAMSLSQDPEGWKMNWESLAQGFASESAYQLEQAFMLLWRFPKLFYVAEGAPLLDFTENLVARGAPSQVDVRFIYQIDAYDYARSLEVDANHTLWVLVVAPNPEWVGTPGSLSASVATADTSLPSRPARLLADAVAAFPSEVRVSVVSESSLAALVQRAGNEDAWDAGMRGVDDIHLLLKGPSHDNIRNGDSTSAVPIASNYFRKETYSTYRDGALHITDSVPVDPTYKHETEEESRLVRVEVWR